MGDFLFERKGFEFCVIRNYTPPWYALPELWSSLYLHAAIFIYDTYGSLTESVLR